MFMVWPKLDLNFPLNSYAEKPTQDRKVANWVAYESARKVSYPKFFTKDLQSLLSLNVYGFPSP
jgi:hypothetical protein